MNGFRKRTGQPSTRTRLPGLERLEGRDQPAALLADLNVVGSPAFFPLITPGDGGATVGGRLYFVADGGAATPGLYSSDGTTAGTVRIVDLASGVPAPSGSGIPMAVTTEVVSVRTAAGDRLFFSNNDPAHGDELWTSDGTAAGTRMVTDLYVGAEGGSPRQLTPLGNRLVFTASTPGQYGPTPALYSTDGTAAGTVRLDPNTIVSPHDVTVAGGKLFFTTTAQNSNFQQIVTIWSSDGTVSGTKPFVALPPETSVWNYAGQGVPWVAWTGGKLYFAASGGQTGTELWVSDGTATGTKMVADLNPVSLSSPYFPGSGPDLPGFTRDSNPQEFTAVGSTVSFAADDGTHGQELWKTDGTAAGTVMVKDLSPTQGSPTFELTGTPSGSRISGLTAINGRLYFGADDGISGPQLYTSDGTAGGTKTLTALSGSTGAYSLSGGSPAVLAALGSRVLFSFGDAAGGQQVWGTDGTPAGTTVVKRIGTPDNPIARVLTGPGALGVVGGKFLFHADDGVGGRQLWATDGTAAGTTVVKQLNPTNQDSAPNSFVALGGKAFFVASDAPGHSAVYASDGASAPVALKQFLGGPVPGLPADSYLTDVPRQLVASGSRVYFVAGLGTTGRQLWATDGTAAGTRLVKEIARPGGDYSGSSNSLPLGIDNLTDAGGTLYFTIDLPGSGQQLWKTDGTAAGTTLLRTVNPKSLAESPYFAMPGTQTWGPIRQLTAVGNRLFFAASDGAVGEELWVSDGTAAGTKLVKDIATSGGDPGSHPTDLTALNGKLYFTADDGANGRQLWVSDGTTAGTKQVATINTNAPSERPPGRSQYTPNVLEPRGMVAAGGKLYVSGYDPTYGRQLWVSDGTQAGTRRLTNTGVVPPQYGPLGPKDARVSNLTAVGSRVFFAAMDPTNGSQLWVTDGTVAGTKTVRVIGTANPTLNSPFPSGADPAVLAVVGDRVLFAAADPAHGRELWVSDGTAAGTTLVRDFFAGPVGGLATNPYGPPATAALVGGRVILGAADRDHGAEPWVVPVSDFMAASPPVVPPVPPAPPTVPPPAQPPATTPKATVVRTFAVAATEGTTVTPNLATVDLPIGPVYKVTVFWGDGRTAVGTLTPTTPGGATFVISAPHLYAGPGTYAVVVRVTADTKTVLSIDTTATVATAAPPVVPPVTSPPVTPPSTAKPTVSKVYAVAATEGTTVTPNLAAVDLPAGSTYQVTVLWGDGQTGVGTLTRTSPTGTAFLISGQHLYAAPGVYTVVVQVTVDAKTVLLITTTATVTDARFYVGRVAQRLPAGQAFSGVVATIQDTNPTGGKATDYVATIDWGDGLTSVGTVHKTAAGRFEVVGDHTFAASAKRTVTVTIRSTGGGTSMALSLFTIDPPLLSRVA